MTTAPTSTGVDALDLTPSPRILEMIAEVDLKIWQCLAELVDNCFDELRVASEEYPEREHRVDITLPSAGQANRDSQVIVADNGRGMSIEQMRVALRAGSSGNQAFGSLGLFGMGFNVATARLGKTTIVQTGREGEDHWTVATINIEQMRRNDTFRVPLAELPKDPGEHGTIVQVTGLKADIVNRLRSNQEVTLTKRTLGRVYTYLLRDPSKMRFSGSDAIGGLGIPLYLNGNRVDPLIPCIWDPSRSVSRSGREIPAVIPIDFPLAAGHACMSCGHWQSVARDTCSECGSDEVVERERRICGWVGIQRYSHKSDFGFSFLRQGRVISYQDKGLFSWADESGTEIEYPVEVPARGRIVGEIHLDHVPVNFRKTDFDREHRSWRVMFEKVHGESPLQPKKATALGLVREDTPLVLLFDGYRRYDPGLNYLVPGNGRIAVNEKANQWAAEFYKGTPGYETDERWYAAAKAHDDVKLGVITDAPADPIDDDFFEQEGLGDLLGGSEADGDASPTGGVTDDAPEPPREETVDERFARYAAAGRPLLDLEGPLTLAAGSSTVLRAFETKGVDLSREGSPHVAVRLKAGEAQIFVDAGCPLIADFGWSASDVALLLGADKIKDVYSVAGHVGDFIVNLFNQFPDRRLLPESVRQRGEDILDTLRDSLVAPVADDPDKFWLGLRADSRRETEDAALRANPNIDWADAVATGEFARYLTPGGVEDLVRAHPGRLLDGVVFSTKYATWNDNGVKDEQVDWLCGLLQDLRRMVSGSRVGNTLDLSRYLMSADLLQSELRS